MLQEANRYSRGTFFKCLNYLKSPEFSWKVCFFGSVDHLVVVIMSHGQLNKFETSGGEDFEVREVQKGVNACPLLDGKPKFFLINAFRVEKRHLGNFVFLFHLEVQILVIYF